MTIKRQIPDGISEELVAENLLAVQDVFGAKWLMKSTNHRHIVKRLWNRRDYLATIELFTLGNALKLLLESGEEEWIKDYAARVKRAKSSDQVGVSFEAIAASFFMEHHSVQMPPCGQPGYDVVVKEMDLSFLISCKKLLLSDVRQKVDNKGEDIKKEFVSLLQQTNNIGLRLLIIGKTEGKIPKLNASRVIIKGMLKSGRMSFENDDFIFSISNIGEDNLSKKKISYQFGMFIPHAKTEQKRFENLFGNAYRNLIKHAGKERGDNVVKLLMVSLPEHISMTRAQEWVQGNFKKHYKKISGVLLTRAIPVQSKNTSFLNLENRFIVNSQADIDLLRKIQNNEFSYFKLQIPVGKISSEESKQVIMIDGAQISVDNYYCFQRALVCYEKRGNNLNIDFESKPGFSYQADFFDANDKYLCSVEPISPPDFMTILL